MDAIQNGTYEMKDFAEIISRNNPGKYVIVTLVLHTLRVNNDTNWFKQTIDNADIIHRLFKKEMDGISFFKNRMCCNYISTYDWYEEHTIDVYTNEDNIASLEKFVDEMNEIEDDECDECDE